MAKTTRAIANFSGGEASPNLYGRTDAVPYFSMAKTLENVIVTHYGGVLRTPGSRFVAKTKASGQVKFIPFIFSTTQSYVLEFGNGYMRVFQSGGSVIETAKNITNITQANPAVVTSNAHGYSNGDIIDIESVGGMIEVNEKRFRVNNVTANTFELQTEESVNVDSTGYTAYTSGGTAERVYQITTPYQTADLQYLRYTQQADVMYIDCKGYEPRKLSRLGNTNWTLSTYSFDTFNWPPFLDENTTATTIHPSGTTGSITVTASAALWSASHVGSYWKYKTGYFQVTSFTSSTSIGATVIETLPSSTPSDEWSEGAWSAVQGYPEDVKFYENRLYHCTTTAQPLDIWGSVIEEYENYKAGTLDTDALNYEIGSNQVDKILWMYPTQVLNIGTAGGPFIASSGSASDPITPTNISVKQQNENGASSVPPVRIGAFVGYVERSGRVFGEFKYSLDTDSFQTDNITYLADHVLGQGVVEMAIQRYPYNILWAVLADGTIATLTREQANNVRGWTRQVISGTNVEVESIAIIPNGVEDQVWISVKRTIDGNTRRFVEYIEQHDFGTIEDAFFVQAGTTYSGAPETDFTNLDYLEGETIQILADGAVRPSQVVTNGAITITPAASKVHFGLGYTSTIRTLDLEGGSATGSAMATPKLLTKVNVRFKDTVGCLLGTVDNQDVIPFRSTANNMDEAVPLFSGDKEIFFPQGWTREKEIVIKQEQPLPLHVLAIYPLMLVSD